MSGPLASWVLAHTAATNPSERFVFSMLALRANPDGTNASLSVDQLHLATGYAESTINLALTALRDSGELILVHRGSGRGQISRHRIRIRWCDDTDQCAECATLSKVLSTGLTSANSHKGSDERTVSRRRTSKGSDEQGVSRKGSDETSKGSDERSKVSDERTPYGNGDGPPSGGTVTHPESDAALAPCGAAPDPGLSEANRAALAAFHAEQRRHKVAKATAQQSQPREPAPTTGPTPPRPALQADTARDPDPTQPPSESSLPAPRAAASAVPPQAGGQARTATARQPRPRGRGHTHRSRKGRRGREPPARCTRSPATSHRPERSFDG